MSFFSSLFKASSISQMSRLDDGMLKDIGLNRSDLFEASRMRSNCAGFFDQRRRERAGL